MTDLTPITALGRHAPREACHGTLALREQPGLALASLAPAPSARLRPSTPSLAQALRARVGPRSGPPCFSEPPTMVGAIWLAFSAQASAPSQPPSAIWSRSSWPTDGAVSFCGSGHSNSAPFDMPTITTRGRSWLTPKSEAE